MSRLKGFALGALMAVFACIGVGFVLAQDAKLENADTESCEVSEGRKQQLKFDSAMHVGGYIPLDKEELEHRFGSLNSAEAKIVFDTLFEVLAAHPDPFAVSPARSFSDPMRRAWDICEFLPAGVALDRIPGANKEFSSGRFTLQLPREDEYLDYWVASDEELWARTDNQPLVVALGPSSSVSSYGGAKGSGPGSVVGYDIWRSTYVASPEWCERTSERGRRAGIEYPSVDPSEVDWFSERGRKIVAALLHDISSTKPIDRARVTLVGMGDAASAVLQYAAKMPNDFAHFALMDVTPEDLDAALAKGIFANNLAGKTITVHLDAGYADEIPKGVPSAVKLLSEAGADVAYAAIPIPHYDEDDEVIRFQTAFRERCMQPRTLLTSKNIDWSTDDERFPEAGWVKVLKFSERLDQELELASYIVEPAKESETAKQTREEALLKYLGIVFVGNLEEASDDDRPIIGAVSRGSPADQWRLRVGDVITHVNGKKIEKATDFYLALLELDSEKIRLSYKRGPFSRHDPPPTVISVQTVLDLDGLTTSNERPWRRPQARINASYTRGRIDIHVKNVDNIGLNILPEMISEDGEVEVFVNGELTQTLFNMGDETAWPIVMRAFETNDYTWPYVFTGTWAPAPEAPKQVDD